MKRNSSTARSSRAGSRTKILMVALAAAAGVLLAGAASANGSALRFSATATGAQEVPEVETAATARVVVFFDHGFTRAHVRVEVKGEPQGVAAHFHCGRAGTNGPVAVNLLAPGAMLTDSLRVTVTNDAFNPLADCLTPVGRPVNNVAALALAMRDGLVYFNLHSPSFPGGEIRGQMLEFGR